MSVPGVSFLVRDVAQDVVRPPSRVAEQDPISRVVQLLLERPESRMVYVTDAEGRLRGTVSWRSVLKATKARYGAREPGLLSLVDLFRNLMPERAGHLMREATPVTMETPLRDVLLRMDETHQNDLPIVDAEGRLVGEVNGHHIMRVALHVFRQTEADLAAARAGAAQGG